MDTVQMKTMKTEKEREPAAHFFIVFILCLKYLITYMITKRSNVYVPHLYTWTKYKSITVYIKNKTGEGTHHFKYVPKE